MASFLQFFFWTALLLALIEASGRGRGASRKAAPRKSAHPDKRSEPAIKKKTGGRRRKAGPVKDDLSMWGYFDTGVQAASARREAYLNRAAAPADVETHVETGTPEVGTPNSSSDDNTSVLECPLPYDHEFELWSEALLDPNSPNDFSQQDKLLLDLFPGISSSFLWLLCWQNARKESANEQPSEY